MPTVGFQQSSQLGPPRSWRCGLRLGLSSIPNAWIAKRPVRRRKDLPQLLRYFELSGRLPRCQSANTAFLPPLDGSPGLGDLRRFEPPASSLLFFLLWLAWKWPAATFLRGPPFGSLGSMRATGVIPAFAIGRPLSSETLLGLGQSELGQCCHQAEVCLSQLPLLVYIKRDAVDLGLQTLLFAVEPPCSGTCWCTAGALDRARQTSIPGRQSQTPLQIVAVSPLPLIAHGRLGCCLFSAARPLQGLSSSQALGPAATVPATKNESTLAKLPLPHVNVKKLRHPSPSPVLLSTRLYGVYVSDLWPSIDPPPSSSLERKALMLSDLLTDLRVCRGGLRNPFTPAAHGGS
ncbi:hypothetical protein M441DRAFT_50257 [Trichoderma asperellum CBS 433.97]|uniref:Uncharacterized protein n=1 Tax=Trichoderma asperellum (strain ATCC 204424 / CBS 433.97 / NBRC 101777) TaxID=1042311 RepID=A0A2T3YZ68_TRIA4|nr:hypothetical protein M441DRAFT_50257 [Trichoderma asperellum CBS 433.97]PTB37847.1 hypothetical protein M441DRAFT_50257 [Trichoderma asperellum CBS 433.97]